MNDPLSNILIIDDDNAIRWVLEEALSDEGFLVKTATNAQSALQLIQQHRFAAVISDIRMPGEDGLQLLQKIKTQDEQLPVIIMTAHSDLDSAVNAYEYGAFDYLPKPFDLDQAIDLVKRAAASNPGYTTPPVTEPLILWKARWPNCLSRW